MNGQTTIYALADPRTGEVRYIGKTVRSLRHRWNCHAWDSQHRRNHRNTWIRSLGAEPVMRVLMIVPNELGPSAEIFAIALYRSLGYRLTNEANGGEGALGVKFSPERLANMSAAKAGKKYSAKRAAALAQQRQTKTHCANGHEYAPSNVAVDKRGWRRCRLCKNACQLRRHYRLRGKGGQN